MLSIQNIDLLAAFEQKARATEPDTFINEFSVEQFRADTLKALENPVYSGARCLMCIDESENMVGRLDFTLIPSFAFGGDLRAYVDWVYVLKENRHRGVAQLMFEKMEEYLRDCGIHEFFLISAENDEAQSFYSSMKSSEQTQKTVLTRFF
jgi:ribosomal protein S18 acetylase RimI-like enzyme